jgi:serine/threonine-protein kinase RsbW
VEGKIAIETIQLSVAAKLTNLAGIRNFVRTALIPFCMDEDFLYELVLAVEEAVTNIILHGYEGKNGVIILLIQPNQRSVKIILQDDAPPFDPTHVPAPRLDLPLDERPLGGLGIHIMRNHSNEMSYRRTPTGLNELKLVKVYPSN